MKKNLLLLVLVLITTSCSEDDQWGIYSDRNEIKFGTKLSETVNTLRSSPANYDPNQLGKNQKVGVFIEENASAPTIVYTPNLSYLSDGEGNLTGVTQYFPNNGNSINISAYHPYSDINENEYIFNVSTDQSELKGIYDSDLMYCIPFEKGKTSDQILLQFNHLLSRIDYNLNSGEGNPDLTGAEVSLVNVYTGIEFNRLTGELGDISENGDIRLGMGTGIIVPQEIPAGTELIRIKLASGNVLYYTTENAIDFAEGKKYTINLQVNLKEASNLGTSVDDWESGETIEGGAEEVVSKKLVPVEIVENGIFSTYSLSLEPNKYILEYDENNRVKVIHYYLTHGSLIDGIEHIKCNLEYDEDGLLIGEFETFYKYYNSGEVADTYTTTFDYTTLGMIKQISVHNEDASSAIKELYVDEKFEYRGSTNDITNLPVNVYDENENIIERRYDNAASLYIEYGNYNSIFKNVNLPRYYITYYIGGYGYFTGKNNVLKFGDNTTYTYEFNEEGYPIRIGKVGDELSHINSFMTITYKTLENK